MVNVSSVYCKFLLSREQFSFCYIRVPDIPEKLSAIVHENQYYSIFKMVASAEECLEFVVKVSITGHALVITQAGERYILWVHETNAVQSFADRKQSIDQSDSELEFVPVTFSSSPCLILTDPTVCQFCYLSIPGYLDRVPGFQYEQKYYRLLQREQDANVLIRSIAERACRGRELAIVLIPKQYAILLLEPLAKP